VFLAACALAAALLTARLQAWQAMLALTLVLWGGLKLFVWRQATGAAIGTITARRHAAVAFWLWPGMNPDPFLAGRTNIPKPAARDWAFAWGKTMLGAAIAWGLARWVPEDLVVVRGWTFLFGLGLFFHCGAVHLLALVWQTAGVAVQPIMNRPLAATSLSDFWSRRWNVAFRELAHRLVMRPVMARFGSSWAIAAVFVFSGVVHDLAISIPARGGYGLPTAYFLLQALALAAERSPMGRRIGLGRGVIGWLATAVVVVAPAGMLFHRPFLETAVMPLLVVAGAGS
jgi:alginate O-acetyltransferase complex protein AlgI